MGQTTTQSGKGTSEYPLHPFEFNNLEYRIDDIITKIVTDFGEKEWMIEGTCQAVDFLLLLTGYKPAFISWPYSSSKTPQLMYSLLETFTPGVFELNIERDRGQFSVIIVNKKFAEQRGDDARQIAVKGLHESAELQRAYLGYPCTGNYSSQKEEDVYDIALAIYPKDSLIFPTVLETYPFTCRKAEVTDMVKTLLERQKMYAKVFEKMGLIDFSDPDTGGFCQMRLNYYKDWRAGTTLHH
jgi:hypothetical protein